MTFVKVAVHGAVASITAAAGTILWAKQLSILAYLFWVLLLFPSGALATFAIWRINGTNESPSPRVRNLEMATGFVVGILAMYIEAIVLSFISPNLFNHPLSAYNLPPGILAGISAWFYRGKFRWVREV